MFIKALGQNSMGFRHTYINENDNDNDNILFDHNVQIEIIIFNSLENKL